MAGLGSGVTEAIIVNPFEVVKVKMQANRAASAEAPSTFAAAKEIVAESGYGRNGLLGKGITATMGRNGAFNMIYFGFYHSVREYVPVLEDPRAEFAKKFALGLAAGTLASCCNIPFDVAKSRIQGPQPEPGKVYYRGTFRTILMVYRQEGYVNKPEPLSFLVMHKKPFAASEHCTRASSQKCSDWVQAAPSSSSSMRRSTTCCSKHTPTKKTDPSS